VTGLNDDGNLGLESVRDGDGDIDAGLSGEDSRQQVKPVSGRAVGTCDSDL
jgi:hypothetical protein